MFTRNPFFGSRKSSQIPQHRKLFNVPPIIIALVFFCCAVYFIPTYFFPTNWLESFYSLFGFVPVLFLYNHDILTQLSAITYSFLHGNLMHLGLNMLWLIIFGTPLANRLGSVFFIIFWLFTAFIAALVYCLFAPGSESVVIGASGAISGMMGASARYNFQTVDGSYMPEAILTFRRAMKSRAVLVALGSFIVLNLLTGLDQWQLGFTEDRTNIAWQAHLGGLLAGFIAIGFFDKLAHNFSL